MIKKFEDFINEDRKFDNQTKDPDALLDYLKKNYEVTKGLYEDSLTHYKNGPVTVPVCKTDKGWIEIWFHFNDSRKYSYVYVGDLYKYLARKDANASKRLEKSR